MPLLYAMKPTVCNSCKAEFEANIISRIGLWVFMSVLFSFSWIGNFLSQVFGKDGFLIGFLSFVGIFFGLLIFAAVMQTFQHFRPFTLWNDRNKERAIVNYGSVISLIIYAAIFYATK